MLLFLTSLLFAQPTPEPNYVEGKIWVNDNIKIKDNLDYQQKNIALEEVVKEDGTTIYRLSSRIGNSVNDIRLFTIIHPSLNSNCNEFNDLPCGESFDYESNTVYCGSACSNECNSVPMSSSIPYWNFPIVFYEDEEFPNTGCFRRMGTLHWYSFYSLNFVNDILGFKDLGIGNSEHTYARYNPENNNSIIASSDALGITTNISTSQKADAICHEWGHYINNHIAGENSFVDNEGASVQEGIADVWSSILRYWAKVDGNFQVFKDQTEVPPFYMYTLNRQFNNKHTIYYACSTDIENSILPEGASLEGWLQADPHDRGFAASRWFFLLSEGTNGEEYSVHFQAAASLENIFISQCNSGNTSPQTRFFQIDGIGHWEATRIMFEALKWYGENNNGENISFYSYREATIQGILNLYQNDSDYDYCNALRQNTESWHSVNVGDKMTADITAPDLVCGGFDIEIEANHVIADVIRLKDSNGNTLPATISTNSDGTLELNYTQATQVGDEDYHFVLESEVSEIDGITLPNNGCTLEQDIHVNVKRVVIESTPPDESLTCVGNTITLTAEAHPSVNIIHYKWTKNGALVSEGPIEHTITVNESVGIYDYTVEVSFLPNTGTTLTETASYTVEFVNPPTLSANVPSNSPIELNICSFDSELELNTIDALDYIEDALMYQLLDENENQMTGVVYETPLDPQEDEVEFEFPGPGTYYIRGTSGNCPSVQIQITVEHTPIEGPIIEVIQEECNPGDPIILEANVDGLDSDSFGWYENDGTESIDNDAVLDNISITQPATYTFRAKDDEGCPTEATYEVGVVDLGIEGNYQVTTNETWHIHAGQDETITIEGVVTVEQSATLTIQSGAIIEFIGFGSGIVVERGGRLEATNVTFQLSDCAGSGSYWRGLQVKGDSYSNHPSNYGMDIVNHPNHGLIELNRCTVREAKVGIRDYFFLSPSLKYMGGGIVDIWKCTFENNETAVRLGRTFNQALTESKIIDCDFINNQGFAQDIHFYRHVVLDGLADAPLITQNLFQTNSSAPLYVPDKGVGILIINSNFRVGTGCEIDANTFVNLFQGIDVYGFGAALTQEISYNKFDGVHKGVSLNYTTSAQLTFNKFENIPAGSSQYLSHGILTESAALGAIQENTFQSAIATQSGYFKRGLVIKNSQTEAEEGLDFIVEGNTFDGIFAAATQFEQNNEDLGQTINCNTYESNISGWNWSWYLHSNCNLPEVGECDPIEPKLSYQGVWQAGGQADVYDASGTLTAINWGNDSEPVVVSPNNNVAFPCGFNLPCEGLDPCMGGIAPPIPPNPPVEPEDDRRFFVQQIQYKLATDDQIGAVNLLEQRQEVWSDKILAATYLQIGNNTQALQTLNRIPTHTADNLAFVDMLTAVAQDQVFANESQIRQHANDLSLKPQTNILAESILSDYFGEHHIRNAADIVGNSSKRSLIEDDEIRLSLMPNPAKNQLKVSWSIPIDTEDIVLAIYNNNGQLVRKISLKENIGRWNIDTDSLQSGVYFCYLQSAENIHVIEKLIIIK